jgi:hypothetical protein
MWRRVATVITDVSKERAAFIFRAEEISELEKGFPLTSVLIDPHGATSQKTAFFRKLSMSTQFFLVFLIPIYKFPR